MISIHLIKTAQWPKGNISVTIPYTREKFNQLWKAAEPS